MPATVAPAPRRGFGWQVRIALLEARFQFLSSLRLPAFAVPTLLFPLFFYLFFGVLFQRGGVSLAAPTYMLATYGVFGILGPSIFGFGVGSRAGARLRRAAPEADHPHARGGLPVRAGGGGDDLRRRGAARAVPARRLRRGR